MATAVLMNYVNGAKVLLKQVLAKHNSLEGEVISGLVSGFVPSVFSRHKLIKTKSRRDKKIRTNQRIMLTDLDLQ